MQGLAVVQHLKKHISEIHQRIAEQNWLWECLGVIYKIKYACVIFNLDSTVLSMW